MRKWFSLLFSVLFFIFCFQTKAVKLSKPYIKSNIDKGYTALLEYDYFKAKKIFYTCAPKYRKLADFGLATIYYRNDNPFHQIDSAYDCIKRCELALVDPSSKAQKKLLTY
jgi:hypothetical protein